MALFSRIYSCYMKATAMKQKAYIKLLTSRHEYGINELRTETQHHDNELWRSCLVCDR